MEKYTACQLISEWDYVPIKVIEQNLLEKVILGLYEKNFFTEDTSFRVKFRTDKDTEARGRRHSCEVEVLPINRVIIDVKEPKHWNLPPRVKWHKRICTAIKYIFTGKAQ